MTNIISSISVPSALRHFGNPMYRMLDRIDIRDNNINNKTVYNYVYIQFHIKKHILN